MTAKLTRNGKVVKLFSKVRIVITLDCEVSPTEEWTDEHTDYYTFQNEPIQLASRVYGAMRGDGDDRQDRNMNADIGWYLKSKIEENIKKTSGNSEFKISSHSYQVKEVNDETD